ncbi:MAG: S8 family serine peptidase [Chitinophagaceae bacterium]|nr:S8 family serine peptidase [Chitinophagaceae bacterium]
MKLRCFHRFIFISFILQLYYYSAQAQFSRYIVTLKDKNSTPFSFSNPSAFLSAKAIERRARYGIALDSTDLPVTPAYLSQIRNVPNITILNVSKWLNSLTVQTNDLNAINTIRNFPFVLNVSGIAARPLSNSYPSKKNFEKEEFFLPEQNRVSQVTNNYYNYGAPSFNEIQLHNGQFLHNIGLRGQGMTIAMLDAGYFNFTNLRAFDSARANGQILSTWDFVSRHESVTEDHPHGMQCLSTILANIPGQFIGMAPQARVHLFRTEDAATEYPIEEHNWVCAAERADSLGCDVISSSLGYNIFDNPVFNYTYSQMNGNVALSTIGADLAARKGMLVFNSAGNEGFSSWRYIIAPSDGDSVIAVGAVNAAGTVAGFSSYGPSSDGQIKPDVVSVGAMAIIQTTANTVGYGNGTSFSCPKMAGLATCLWQAFPEFQPMRIARALRESGHKANQPDDRVGYGIPDMKKAFSSLLTEYATSSVSISQCKVALRWRTKDVSSMRYEIERKAPGDTGFIRIASLSATAGQNLSIKDYEWTQDLSGGSFGNYLYRIKQILDTSTTAYTEAYIDTAILLLTQPCRSQNTNREELLIKVLSTPVNSGMAEVLTESVFAVANLQLVVLDASGRKMITVAASKPAGRKIIRIPVNQLSSGSYLLQAFDGNRRLGSTSFIRL